MPIKPENRKRYPSNWASIAQSVKDRAKWKCEFCGAEHNYPHPITMSLVVLTVAHLDHQPENNAAENLKALCQRCHNRYDRAHRAENAKRTREAKGPQMDLFKGDSK